MTNFQTARDALETSLGSSGSAMAEHAKWSESLEARLNKLKSTWQSLSQSFLNSDFLKVTIESLRTLVDLLDKLVSNVGTLGTIGLGVGLFNLIKSGALSTFVKTFLTLIPLVSDFDTFGQKIKGVGSAISDSGNAAKKAMGGFSAWATGIGLAVAALGLLYNAYKKQKEAEAAARQEAIDSANAYLEASRSFEQAYIKYSGKTSLTAEEEADLESAIKGTTDALGDKSSALQDVVNNSNDYLASLEQIKEEELKAAKAEAETKREKTKGNLKEAAIGWSAYDGSEVGTEISDETAKKILNDMNSEFAHTTNMVLGRGQTKKVTLVDLPADADINKIIEYYDFLKNYQVALSEAGLGETDTFKKVEAAIGKMSEAVNAYRDSVGEFAKIEYQDLKEIPKTAEEYIEMRKAVLKNDDVANLTLEHKKAIVNSLDKQYGSVFDLSSAEVQAQKFIGLIKKYGNGTKDGTNDIGTVETFLNIKTAVNNGKCSVGDYISTFEEVKSLGEQYSDEEKEYFTTSLGLDADKIKDQYDDVYKYISRNHLEKLDTTGMAVFEIREYVSQEKQRIQELLNNSTKTELQAIANIQTEIDWTASIDDIKKQIKEEAELIEALNFEIDIEADTTALEALNTALAESKSATGLTVESISALKDRYKDLDSYDAAALFEETANGIRINSTEVAKLEKEYKDLNKQEIDDNLKTLKREYSKLTDEIGNCTDDQEKLNELYTKRDAILDQINDIAALAAQYEGLTSAYNEWQSAQEAGQDRDMYESILSGRDDIEDEMSRGWLDDAAIEYLELLSGKELSTLPIEDQIAAYKELDKTIGKSEHSIWDFFTEDEEGNSTSDGVYNFFDTVKSVAGETAAWVDKNGVYHFDFEGFEYNNKTGDAAIADILGTSEELVQVLLRAAEDAGFVINIEGEYTDLADAVNEAEKANDRMKELGATTYTFNFDTTNIDSLNEQIGEAKTMLSNLKNEDGTLKVGVSEEDYRQARDIMYSLILQKQRLDDSAVLHVNTEQAESDIEIAISKLQDFKTYANTLEVKTAVGADTSEVTSNIQSVLDEINGLDANIKAGLGLDEAEVQTAIGNIQANINAGVAIKQEDIDVVNTAISSISNDAMINLGLDTTLIDNYKSVEQTANGVVNWDNNIEKVTTWINQKHEANGTVKWDDDTTNLKTTYTGKGVIYWDTSEANGTANVNGTTGGKAFKQGDWGIKGSGSALGGELGTEILVRDGRWYTIGEHGAEFFDYKQGDIIFNHRQTEELFANGRVTSGGGRGKTFANGNAFVGGKAFAGSNATGNMRDIIKSSVREGAREGTKEAIKESTSNFGSSGGNGSRNTIQGAVREDAKVNKEKAEKTEKDKFEETIDFVEIALSRIEREVDKLDKKANNVYKSWSSRNTALADEINKVGDEIAIQQQAAQRYWQEANSVGLDGTWAERVRNGTIGIYDENDFDEDTAKKIKEYQQWYELYLKCTDAAEDLKETESSLYAQRFENVQSQYESILQGYEHTEAMLNEYISQAEAKGHIISTEYYDALINNEKQNIETLKQEQSALIAERDKAVDEGKITKGSQAWYDQCAAIDAVTQAIEEANTAVIGYNKSIREIEWEKFDLTQERISDVTAESDFLIELMSNKKLYDDDGQLTDQGMATMGLHGQNYNTYMYKSDYYGKEIAKLDKEIANDPYDQELFNRRRELIELQRESILNAEQEKDSIRDMVEEGINLELDALQEKIDLYNEALDSQKDLYDYQKRIKEQTEEIASLEKQMSAYAGDDSEESRAKIQELKVSLEDAKENLEETQYDRYIGDQQQLLDSLYEQYSEILNTRLDNIDGLMADMITEINANASTISSTLTTEAANVGIALSDKMDNIWADGGNAKSVVAMYGNDYQLKSTTTNATLNSIKLGVDNMVKALDKDAKKEVDENKTAPSSEKNPATNNNKPATTPKAETPKTETKSIKVGGKINAGNAQIYDYVGDTSGERQYYRDDPIYTVLDERNGYLKVRYHKLSSGTTGWFKKSDVKAYATGKKNFLNDEIAWTQEKGQEFIVRPSDGAILTPVAKGDSVLNATASGNIWNMANNPAEFIKNNLGLDATNIPNGANVNNNVTQNFENVNFHLPNVHSYNELIAEMQRDPKFEKLILSMTVDQIAGKSKLTKGKSIR